MPSPRLIAPALASLTLCAGALAQNTTQPVLRVYDARDLAAALPRGSGAGSLLYTDVPVLGKVLREGEYQIQFQGAKAAEGPMDIIVSRLCTQLSLESEKLLDGVYVVKGEQSAQEQLGALLDKTRSLYLGAYEIELACTTVPSASAPAIGSTAETGNATIRTRQTVSRRVETVIAVSESQSYVQDWTPVVGNDAVGYDPQISQVERGLQVTVLLGAGPDPKVEAKTDTKTDSKPAPDGPVSVVVRGQISDARVEIFKSLQAQPPETTLEIGLPTTSTRTIAADTRLPQARPTVMAVVPGFKAGESIVVTVTVRELK